MTAPLPRRSGRGRDPEHHSHDHDHDDDHHDHDSSDHNKRVLAFALALTALFMAVETAGGFIANSLALLADAGHMFTDAAALALALAAVYFAKRAPDAKRSFGYQRLQVLATFINGMALLSIVGFIAIEAVQKLMNPAPVNARLMLGIAATGAAVNIAVFLMLRRGEHDDMNIAAATLHVLGDLLGSVGAVIAALVILFTGWLPADPLLSVLLCGLIVRSAWALVRRSAHILLEGSPDWLDEQALRATLHERVPAIVDVHHVHCWSLSPKETLLTLHATVTPDANHMDVLAQAQRVLAERYGITHATIQIEAGACVDAACEAAQG